MSPWIPHPALSPPQFQPDTFIECKVKALGFFTIVTFQVSYTFDKCQIETACIFQLGTRFSITDYDLVRRYAIADEFLVSTLHSTSHELLSAIHEFFQGFPFSSPVYYISHICRGCSFPCLLLMIFTIICSGWVHSKRGCIPHISLYSTAASSTSPL